MTSSIEISDLVASFLIIALSFMVNKWEDNSQIVKTFYYIKPSMQSMVSNVSLVLSYWCVPAGYANLSIYRVAIKLLCVLVSLPLVCCFKLTCVT